jgi:lipooligosaccharide transport system ATP-binding protein
MDVRREPRRIKAILGVVPQEDSLDPDLTVRQNLLVYARYFGIPKDRAIAAARDAIEFMQLADKTDVPIDALSGGMRRRLLIGRALINQPLILILDEPTTGLDPQAKHLLWQKMRQLKAQGITMLLSTHNMEEAAHLCDRLVIINQGKILTEGVPTELVEHYVGRSAIELHISEETKAVVLAQLEGQPSLTIEAAEDIIYVFSRDSVDRFELSESVPEGTRVVYRPANLEDVFLRLTGRGLIE